MLLLAALGVAVLALTLPCAAAAQTKAPLDCQRLIPSLSGAETTSGQPGVFEALIRTASIEIASTAFLPARTASILCTLAENGVMAQMSRSDTLWFQAGYGGLEQSDPKGADFAFPKWSNDTPSIFRVLPGQTGQPDPIAAAPTDRNGFSFQIGR